MQVMKIGRRLLSTTAIFVASHSALIFEIANLVIDMINNLGVPLLPDHNAENNPRILHDHDGQRSGVEQLFETSSIRPFAARFCLVVRSGREEPVRFKVCAIPAPPLRRAEHTP
jgi:hypothetical protein